MNLGTSYPTYADQGVLDVITQGQGQTLTTDVNFPTGKKPSSVDIYSRTYKSPSQADERDRSLFGNDPYTATKSRYQYPSMVTSSAIAGLIGLVLSFSTNYCLGLYHSIDWFWTWSSGFLPNLGSRWLAFLCLAICYSWPLVNARACYLDSSLHDWLTISRLRSFCTR